VCHLAADGELNAAGASLSYGQAPTDTGGAPPPPDYPPPAGHESYAGGPEIYGARYGMCANAAAPSQRIRTHVGAC